MRSILALLIAVAASLMLAAAGAAQALPAGSVIALKSNEPMVGDEPGGPLLVRELVRQSVLMAARDELRLSTRDEALREPLQQDRGLLDIAIDGKAPLSARLTLGPGGDLIWEGRSSVKNWSTPTDLLLMVETAESWARRDLPEALRNHGFRGTAMTAKPGALAPGPADQNLQQLDLLSQFGAVRLAHDAIRADGESMARLGVLVRGYANLAQLTSFHWNAVHKTFAARSLLYAQRMVGNDPRSAEALWHRAYARALIGLHAAALDDLAQADKLRRSEGPPWVKLIEPLCRYQTKKLDDVAAADQAAAPMASYFSFLTLEHCGSQGAVMNAAQAASQLNPQCMRLIDAMCEQTGPGMLNWLTETGPQTFSRYLGERLELLPGLPESLINVIEEQKRSGGNPEGRGIIVESFLKHGESDTCEPSWAALGRLIQDVTFVQVWRRGQLISGKWGIDASEYVQQVLPALGDHPYRALIESYGLDPRASFQQHRQLLEQIKPVDFDFAMIPLADALRQAGLGRSEQGRDWRRLPIIHADATAYDEEVVISESAEAVSDFKTSHVNKLRDASPHAPLALSMLVHDDWETAAPNAKQWEEQFGWYPAMSFALGEKYAKIKKWDDAERCFRKYIDVAQDLKGYWALAEVYKKRGSDGQWLATLQQSLEQPDYGLQHATTRVRLAEYYMARGDFARAVPLAEAAATQSGAEWARDCAAQAREGIKDWEHAEQWVRQNADHYGHLERWLAWCRRTGHGDVQGATRMARRYARDLAMRTDAQSLRDLATAYLLMEQAKDAVTPLKMAWEMYGDGWAALHLAVIGDQLNDAGARDAALAAIIAASPGHGRSDAAALAAAARDGLSKSGRLDLAQIERIESRLDPYERSSLDYFVGRFLDRFGQKDDAQRYYIRSCTGPGPQRINPVLAAMQLRARGIEPMNLPRQTPATQPEGS